MFDFAGAVLRPLKARQVMKPLYKDDRALEPKNKKRTGLLDLASSENTTWWWEETTLF